MKNIVRFLLIAVSIAAAAQIAMSARGGLASHHKAETKILAASNPGI